MLALLARPQATRRPDESSIYRLKDRVINHFFHRQYQQQQIEYQEEDIIKFLNALGKEMPNNMGIKGPWGDMIKGAASAKTAVHTMGVRGSQTRHHCKQAILSSMMVLDDQNEVTNMPLLREMAPHKCNKSRKAYLEKCKQVRLALDRGISDVLCVVQLQQRRESLVLSPSYL